MTSALLGPTVAPVSFPPGYDAASILRDLRHSCWRETDRRGEPAWSADGAAYRRWLTRDSPLHFALTYLGPFVTDRDSGAIAFAELHLAMLRTIAAWRTPGRHRDAHVGARRGGKSVYRGVVGPLWALGHGHRRFVQAFGASDYTARGHLGSVLDILHGRHPCSALILADFPELRPVRGAGGPGRTVLAGGGILAGRGIGAATIGELVGAERPDVLVGDDVTPGADITPGAVEKAKAAIRANVLPMNDEAAVLLCGTVFAVGDLMDDVVRTARGEAPRGPDKGLWLRGEGITPHYHPADWPQRWPDLEARRARAEQDWDLRTYAMAFEPHLLGTAAAAQWFGTLTWRYGSIGLIGKRAIFIDEAYSLRKGADQTALAVMAVDTSGQRVCVEHVETCPNTLEAKRAAIWRLHRWATESLDRPVDDPHITVGVESVRDGDGAVQALAGYPPGSRPIAYTPGQAPKARRIEGLYRRYVERWICHRAELAEYQAQAEAWHPRATWDDMLDVVSAADRWLRTGTAEM